MNPRLAAILGALTADAASLGLHWLYDPEYLQELAAEGPVEFLEPDAERYSEVQGYFAHRGKRVGEFSGYGEACRLMLRHLVGGKGRFDRPRYQQAYLRHFGPGGAYVGYVDKPTRLTVARLASIGKPDDYPALSGCDDDQLPALECVPALVASHRGETTELLAVVAEAVAVTHDHPLAHHGATAGAIALAAVIAGAPFEDALRSAAAQAGAELKPLLSDALAIPELNTAGAARRFGMACHIHQGLPLLFHLAYRTSTYREAVVQNILAGGDSCGRSLLLGALKAAQSSSSDSGIPISWLARVRGMANIAQEAEALVMN